MYVNITGKDFAPNDHICDHVQCHLRFSLGRSVGRVEGVSVALFNGRGGLDTSCNIRVRMGADSDIEIEQTDPEIYAAIDRAIERVARAVRRAIQVSLTEHGAGWARTRV